MKFAWPATTCHCGACSSQASYAGFQIRGFYMSEIDCPSASDKEILQFYGNLDQPTKDKISQSWNPLAGSQAQLVADEFRKYGSCYNAGKPGPVGSPLVGRGRIQGALARSDAEQRFDDYVAKNIAIYDRFDLFEQLEKHGIEPSTESVSSTKLGNALDSIFKRAAYYLSCAYDEKTGFAHLDEIRLCLDSDFNPTTCNNSNILLPRVISDCPQQIYYLPSHQKRPVSVQDV